MNTKQILAVAAIALVAVAAIAGTAYAYQATLTNSGNTVESDYIALDATSFSDVFDRLNSGTGSLDYSTTTTAADTATYVPMDGSSEATAKKFLNNKKGAPVNSSPFVLTVNPQKMDSADLLTLSVTPSVDLDSKYWLAVTYNKITSAVELDGTSAIDFFVCDKRDANYTVDITLYAVEFEGTASTTTDIPGIDSANFTFKATSSALPTGSGTCTITGTTTAQAVTAQNGYGKLYATTVTSSSTTYTFTHLAAGMYYAIATNNGTAVEIASNTVTVS